VIFGKPSRYAKSVPMLRAICLSVYCQLH